MKSKLFNIRQGIEVIAKSVGYDIEHDIISKEVERKYCINLSMRVHKNLERVVDAWEWGFDIHAPN